jgi:hypothetical protein
MHRPLSEKPFENSLDFLTSIFTIAGVSIESSLPAGRHKEAPEITNGPQNSL